MIIAITVMISLMLWPYVLINGIIHTWKYEEGQTHHDKYNVSIMCLLPSSYYTMHDCTINLDERSQLYTCFGESSSVVYDIFNGSQIQGTIETKSQKRLLQF